MKDVQNQSDTRGIYLDQVGIKNFIFPIEIRNRKGEWIITAATISLFVGLTGLKRGTHMSRFVEILQKKRRIDLKEMRGILEETRSTLEAGSSFIKLKFNYFIEKKAPVSGIPSTVNVLVEYDGSLVGDDFEFDMKVSTPVTTLCPCSKAISDYSAHNQRANVSILVRSKKFIWIEQLVEIAEDSASSPIYSLLKRPDEKYVTEHAYDKPRFVEDVCREAKQRVERLDDIREFRIEVESMESIHNHSAYAMVQS